MVGMLATGLLADKVGLIYGDPTVFLRHCAALLMVAGYSFGGSYLLYHISDAIIPIRVRPEQEEEGLDLSQHSETVDAAS